MKKVVHLAPFLSKHSLKLEQFERSSEVLVRNKRDHSILSRPSEGGIGRILCLADLYQDDIAILTLSGMHFMGSLRLITKKTAY